MNVYNNPAEETWKELIQRPQLELGFLESSVRNILNRVKKSGDQALRELTFQFDKVQVDDLEVTKEEMSHARKLISDELKSAIKTAAENAPAGHAAASKAATLESPALTASEFASLIRNSREKPAASHAK